MVGITRKVRHPFRICMGKRVCGRRLRHLSIFGIFTTFVERSPTLMTVLLSSSPLNTLPEHRFSLCLGTQTERISQQREMRTATSCSIIITTARSTRTRCGLTAPSYCPHRRAFCLHTSSQGGWALHEHNGRGVGGKQLGAPFTQFWFDDNSLAIVAAGAYGAPAPEGLSDFPDFTRWHIVTGNTTTWKPYSSPGTYIDLVSLATDLWWECGSAADVALTYCFKSLKSCHSHMASLRASKCVHIPGIHLLC